jgi:hypothetical protein
VHASALKLSSLHRTREATAADTAAVAGRKLQSSLGGFLTGVKNKK